MYFYICWCIIKLKLISVSFFRMRSLFSIALVLLVVLMITVEGSMKKKGSYFLQNEIRWCNAHSFGVISLIIILYFATEKGKEPKADAECSEWQYGKCVPNSGDCGAGIREATCNEQTKKTKCKVPCNWKKDFGGKEIYCIWIHWMHVWMWIKLKYI